MPQAELLFPDQISTILPVVANNLAIAGTCSKGLASRSYTYEPSQIASVETDLGSGIAVEAIVTELRLGKRSVTVFPVTPTIAGSLSAVSKNGGSGPTITIAALAASGAVLIDGPYDDLHVALWIVLGGAAGVAKFRYSTDDLVEDGAHVGAFSGDITVPAAVGAEIVGTVDLSTITLSDLNGKTFVGQSNGPVSAVHTFTTPADVAAIVTALNATFSGIDFDLVGANKLRMRSATTGPTGTLAVGVGVATANTLLGFTASAIVSSTPAVITGSTDLTTLVGAYGGGGSLDGDTVIVTTDLGAITTTLVAPADAAAVVSQINAAAGTDFVASLNGSNNLVLTGSTTSWIGTMLIGAGTANGAFGLTPSATDTGESVLTPSASGAAATYTIPGTGVVVTFPAGTYVASEATTGVYTFDTKAGRIAPAGIAAVFTRVHAAITTGALVGGLWFCQEDHDTIEGRSFADALSTALTSSRASKFLFWAAYGLTKDCADADVITRAASFEDRHVFLSAGDFYGAGGNLAGSRYHRPAIWAAMRKAARDRFSSDLGNHSDGTLASLGVTKIGRDERTASTKLATFRAAQTADGGGFLCLETLANTANSVYFYQGRTMAAAGSIYGDGAAVRVLFACGRQIQSDLDFFMNSDPPATTAGALTDSAADVIENRLRTGLNAVLFEDVEAPEGHASAIGDIAPVYTLATKTLGATFEIQRRLPVKAIVASVGVTDTLSTVEA